MSMENVVVENKSREKLLDFSRLNEIAAVAVCSISIFD